MSLEDLSARVQRLNDFLTDAEIHISDGKVADLAGLDREVTAICSKASALSAEDALQFQPVMADLIGNLERLAFSLRDFTEQHKKQ